jgi:hypothetical protein
MVAIINDFYFGGEDNKAKLAKIEKVVAKIGDLVTEWQYIEPFIVEKGFQFPDKSFLSGHQPARSGVDIILQAWMSLATHLTTHCGKSPSDLLTKLTTVLNLSGCSEVQKGLGSSELTDPSKSTRSRRTRRERLLLQKSPS